MGNLSAKALKISSAVDGAGDGNDANAAEPGTGKSSPARMCTSSFKFAVAKLGPLVP